MNNTKQLTLAWIMYAGDNSDKTAQLYDNGGDPGSTAEANTNWCCGNMHMYPSCTNTLFLTAGQLFLYINNVNVYHCPADQSFAHQFDPRAGADLRVRSFSMNQAFGAGEWLPYPIYKTYRKLGGVVKPSDTWVFIDENENSINDGAFAVVMANGSYDSVLQDAPSGRHGGSTGMSFSDGHSIIHKWISPTTYMPTLPFASGRSYSDPGFVSDLVWLSSVTTVHNSSLLNKCASGEF